MPSPRFALNRSNIRRKVLQGFGLLLALFTLIAALSWRSTVIFSRSAESVARAQEALQAQEETKRLLMEMESARRGYLFSGDEVFLRDFAGARRQIAEHLSALQATNTEAPEQAMRLDRLRALLARSDALQEAEIEARRTGGVDAAAQIFSHRASEDLTAGIRRLLDDCEVDQRRILQERAQSTRAVGHYIGMALVAGGVVTIVALFVACSMILRDIAARRRAEESLAAEHNLLSSIMDTMPNHVFLKDVKGRFILDNAAHRRYLGLAEDQSIEGRTVSDFFPAANVERFEADDQRVVETGQSILNQEEPIQRDGVGEPAWLETTKVPLRDTDGQIIGLVGISSDISRRKAAEQQLVRFAQQLESSNAELQNFASVASHDLQEPLRKIQAFGDRLRAKCADRLGEQGLDYLGRMENAAQRMRVLIHDLLMLSRVTSRAQPFAPCNLQQIAVEVLSDLEVAIESKAAKVEVGPLPEIDADPLQMRQLFQNLISNALKFQKPDAPPLVRISARILDNEDASLSGAKRGEPVCELSFADEGIGFEQKFADQIFVVFQRLHSRAEYEGTGIGLAVCRKITDRHGGRIVAHSQPGQGATFMVTLPVKQPLAATHEPKRSDADYDPDGR